MKLWMSGMKVWILLMTKGSSLLGSSVMTQPRFVTCNFTFIPCCLKRRHSLYYTYIFFLKCQLLISFSNLNSHAALWFFFIINRCVKIVLVAYFLLSLCFSFSVSVGDFDIGLNHISSFFSYQLGRPCPSAWSLRSPWRIPDRIRCSCRIPFPSFSPFPCPWPSGVIPLGPLWREKVNDYA